MSRAHVICMHPLLCQHGYAARYFVTNRSQGARASGPLVVVQRLDSVAAGGL